MRKFGIHHLPPLRTPAHGLPPNQTVHDGKKLRLHMPGCVAREPAFGISAVPLMISGWREANMMPPAKSARWLLNPLHAA